MQFDRRRFLGLFSAGIAGLALEQAIPFGRVWSFPSKIVYNIGVDFGFEDSVTVIEEWHRQFPVGSTVSIKFPPTWNVVRRIGSHVYEVKYPGSIVPFKVIDSYCGGPPTDPPVAQLKSGLGLPDFGIPES
jgi:hypothetical protein